MKATQGKNNQTVIILSIVVVVSLLSYLFYSSTFYSVLSSSAPSSSSSGGESHNNPSPVVIEPSTLSHHLDHKMRRGLGGFGGQIDMSKVADAGIPINNNNNNNNNDEQAQRDPYSNIIGKKFVPAAEERPVLEHKYNHAESTSSSSSSSSEAPKVNSLSTESKESWVWGGDLPQRTRVIKPGSMVTMDYNPNRLNIHINKDSVIERVNFG